ncbi:MAG: hypothetical protein WA941_12455 [Nitrososphaeraceae archaeon]|jgi:hypothetical protein
MEGPPLWVWAIVVGTIIAGKFIYRWKLTNELSKDTKYSDQSFNKVKGDWTPVKKGRVADHKYDPQNFSPSRFKDYLAMRKKGVRK